MFSELPDFLSDKECDHIIELAEMFGLEGSIMHTDEYQEKHRKEVKGTILKEGLNEVNQWGGGGERDEVWDRETMSSQLAKRSPLRGGQRKIAVLFPQ